MKTLLAISLCFIALGATVAGEKKNEAKIDPAQLFGRWELSENPKLVTFVFEKTAFTLITHTDQDVKFELKGSYSLEGNQLTIKLDMGKSQAPKTITKLTDTELVITDDKKTATFKKVKK